MRLMRPYTTLAADLVSSNVAETSPLYNSGTTYALDAVVRSDLDTGSVQFKSLVPTNSGNPLSDASKWQPLGPTNRWKALDGKIGAQAERADIVEYKIKIRGRVDGVTLLNVDGMSVQVIAEDDVDGEVFNQTARLISNYGVIDLWSHLTEPIQRRREIHIGGIPPLYAGLTLTIRVLFPGETARCGEIIPCQTRKIGLTQYGAAVGIRDFSRKDKDDFGNDIVVKRGFAKTATFPVNVATAMFDEVFAKLSEYRATPIVFEASPQFGSTLIFGYVRDFRQVVATPTLTTCSLEIEGLTQ